MKIMTGLTAAAVTIALTASPAYASSGLAGRWQLNDGTGTVAADSSGYGDSGQVVGGATWTSGPSRSALHFDGATGLVRIPDAPQLEPAQAISVSAWVQETGSPGQYKYMLAKGGSGCIAASYGLYSGPYGGLEFYVSRGYGSIYARSPDAGAAVWDGRWHLAVGTFDGTTIRLYVDGRQVGSGTQYPGPLEYFLVDSNDLLIGGYPSCAGKDFSGSISDVRVWSYSLSAAEVSALESGSQSTASESTSSAGGNPSLPGSPASESGPRTGSPAGLVPVIRSLRLAPSRLTHALFAHTRWRGPVITYFDTESSGVSFTVWKVQATGAHRSCVNFAGAAGQHAARCQRYTVLSRFVRQDRRGVNHVHFPSQLRPAVGRYLLQATPRAGQKVGKTVTVRFRVVG